MFVVKNPLASWQPPCALLQIPHSIPKPNIIELPVPLNTYTPLAQNMPKRPQNHSNPTRATNRYFSVLCVLACRGSVLASANGMPMAGLKILPQVLVLHLTPALLVLSWLTPHSRAQPPIQASWFYFGLSAPCDSLCSQQHSDYT